MSFDVWSELVDMRERIAVMETTLLDIRRTMDKQPTTSGSIVLPVGLVTVLVQVVVETVKHFT